MDLSVLGNRAGLRRTGTGTVQLRRTSHAPIAAAGVGAGRAGAAVAQTPARRSAERTRTAAPTLAARPLLAVDRALGAAAQYPARRRPDQDQPQRRLCARPRSAQLHPV